MGKGTFYCPPRHSRIFVTIVVGVSGSAPVRSFASTNAVDWSRVVDSHFESGELVVRLGPILLLGAVAIILGLIAWRLWLRQRLLPDFDVVEAELDIAHVGKVKIKPNH